MHQFAYFNIWSEELNKLLCDIVSISPALEKEKMFKWFCSDGVEIFTAATVKVVTDISKKAHETNNLTMTEYSLHKTPIFTKQDIINKYTTGFDSLTSEFIKLIPKVILQIAKDAFEVCFMNFKIAAINNHLEFYDLEAKIFTRVACKEWELQRYHFDKYVDDSSSDSDEEEALQDINDSLRDMSLDREDDDDSDNDLSDDSSDDNLQNDIKIFIAFRDEYEKSKRPEAQQLSPGSSVFALFAATAVAKPVGLEAKPSAPTSGLR
jgi:hypothetical protein